ncbi:hypothetical protein ABL840_26760 [Variovorax sp. NFACC27]|uniref:hypothetical protein n=1 Tax=unclassified Variovorax TaxID=663243 RepID=UPI000897E2F5|nr:hypothetical protein SAMN03159371_03697 [Variovorax sp. NFACC28]SEG78115.1 hypothetical protein SAMN03159365_03776 [Variovorax sp. NFACC29]SFC95898.1 hypothetical protein SAMN03159379_03647 [Variovorax sp. NFACC26]SFG09018.1 hypothetical protein SAMN03159447_01755 [Variovorax sp. NFACC27]
MATKGRSDWADSDPEEFLDCVPEYLADCETFLEEMAARRLPQVTSEELSLAVIGIWVASGDAEAGCPEPPPVRMLYTDAAEGKGVDFRKVAEALPKFIKQMKPLIEQQVRRRRPPVAPAMTPPNDDVPF